MATSYPPSLQIDPNQPPPMQPPAAAQQQPQTPGPPRKRKKADPDSGEPPTPAEPRRLRRSHEACARCRSKKIKASPVGRHRRQIPVLSPLASRTDLVRPPSSATQSTPAAPPVPTPAYNATKRTATGRPLLPGAIPSASSDTSCNVSHSSSGIYPTSS